MDAQLLSDVEQQLLSDIAQRPANFEMKSDKSVIDHEKRLIYIPMSKLRSQLRVITISSIVLVAISMVMFVYAVIVNKPAFFIGSNLIFGIPTMVLIFLSVRKVSAISLSTNTKKWGGSTDVCCNPMIHACSAREGGGH